MLASIVFSVPIHLNEMHDRVERLHELLATLNCVPARNVQNASLYDRRLLLEVLVCSPLALACIQLHLTSIRTFLLFVCFAPAFHLPLRNLHALFHTRWLLQFLWLLQCAFRCGNSGVAKRSSKKSWVCHCIPPRTLSGMRTSFLPSTILVTVCHISFSYFHIFHYLILFLFLFLFHTPFELSFLAQGRCRKGVVIVIFWTVLDFPALCPAPPLSTVFVVFNACLNNYLEHTSKMTFQRVLWSVTVTEEEILQIFSIMQRSSNSFHKKTRLNLLMVQSCIFVFAGPLPFPKLGLQYLTVQDYLQRNWELFRLESTYEIREDLEDALVRLRPSATADGSSAFAGWARMALPIQAFTVIEVPVLHISTYLFCSIFVFLL